MFIQKVNEESVQVNKEECTSKQRKVYYRIMQPILAFHWKHFR